MGMFSLFININHKKMLDKTKSINSRELEQELMSIIHEGGGVISEFSNLLSHFPSKYEYSRRNFLYTAKNLYKILLANPDLLGFSLIVDTCEVQSDFDFTERNSRLVLSTSDINGLWFTKDAYSLVSNWLYGDKGGKLVHIFNGFVNMDLNMDNLSENLINSNFQDICSGLNDGVNYLKGDMTDQVEKNLLYWSESHGINDVLLFNPGISCEPRLTLIDFIMTQKSKFDPARDLDESEKNEWGRYLDLYIKFRERSYDCFILDDALIHFNKLILLWFESYTKRYNTLLVVWGADHMDSSLWDILSLTDNLKIICIRNGESSIGVINIPNMESVDRGLGRSIEEFLRRKDSDAVMMLYIILLTRGAVLTSDLLHIVKQYKDNILNLKEEIDHFKRMGLLIGDQFLFSGDKSLKGIIEEQYGDVCDSWRDEFLFAFEKINYQRIFSYSYIYAIVGLNSEHSDVALKVLYTYIRKILDLGLIVDLRSDFIEFAEHNETLRNILEYKRIRENRLQYNISNVTVSGEHSGFRTPLEFLSLLNIWSEHRSENLMDRSKKLYFHYQNNGDSYNESRVKTLFALGILSEGNINECVDYFELNCSYSKMISDTYSYIRNGSFLAMSLFVKGDFSGALRVTNTYLKHSWIFFKTRWHLYLLFIRARALMELGYYEEALIYLEEGIVIIKNHNYQDILETFRNWKGRILFYMGREGAARETLLSGRVNREANFFLAEIEFFAGHMERAAIYIQKAEDGDEDMKLFDEKLLWKSGYFVVEEFFHRDRKYSILDIEIKNFSYLIDMSRGKTDKIEEYIEIINHIPNSSPDIYNYKYIFFLYKVTDGVEIGDKINRDNIINKSVRLVQQRASNMSEHNHKHLYLENFYNKQIMNELKSRKVY